MNLAFIDIAYGYNADRPDTDEPLGGTTSAVCFLARELVKAGVNCSFYNQIHEPQTAHGIISRSLKDLPAALDKEDISAFIFCGRWMDEMVAFIGSTTKAPLIAWMHEAELNHKLLSASEAFDGIAFVSDWQRRINKPHIKSHWKEAVLKNAMNPKAAQLFLNESSILETKTEPPLLLYAGGAARGVFHLPKILENLDKRSLSFNVEIFCNTNPSGEEKADKEYIGWLRGRPHVTHVGMVGQRDLISHLKKATVLLAPNPWPETSCITLIEAMAAGLTVVTTNRAALPETASGFAKLISIEGADHPSRFDGAISSDVFSEIVATCLKEIKTDPEKSEKRLRAQIDYFLANYQWAQRVKPWVEFIETFHS